MKVYTPIKSYVIVDVFPEVEGVTKSGLISGILPKLSGKVVAVGPKVEEVKKDDIVVFEQGAPIPINPIENALAWMEEGQIIYVVTEVPDEPVKE